MPTVLEKNRWQCETMHFLWTLSSVSKGGKIPAFAKFFHLLDHTVANAVIKLKQFGIIDVVICLNCLSQHFFFFFDKKNDFELLSL